MVDDFVAHVLPPDATNLKRNLLKRRLVDAFERVSKRRGEAPPPPLPLPQQLGVVAAADSRAGGDGNGGGRAGRSEAAEVGGMQMDQDDDEVPAAEAAAAEEAKPEEASVDEHEEEDEAVEKAEVEEDDEVVEEHGERQQREQAEQAEQVEQEGVELEGRGEWNLRVSGGKNGTFLNGAGSAFAELSLHLEVRPAVRGVSPTACVTNDIYWLKEAIESGLLMDSPPGVQSYITLVEAFEQLLKPSAAPPHYAVCWRARTKVANLVVQVMVKVALPVGAKMFEPQLERAEAVRDVLASAMPAMQLGAGSIRSVKTLYKHLRAPSQLDVRDLAEPLVGVTLLPHQRQSLMWMLDREKSSAAPLWHQRGSVWLHPTGLLAGQRPQVVRGGILGDEPGMGKTMTVLALLALEKQSAHPATSPTLIILPAELETQWMDQLRRYAPQLKVAVLSSLDSDRWAAMADLLRTFDVVIAASSILTVNLRQRQTNFSGKGKRSKLHEHAVATIRTAWWRVVIDESQKVRNATTMIATVHRTASNFVMRIVTHTSIVTALSYDAHNDVLETLLGVHESHCRAPLAAERDAHHRHDHRPQCRLRLPADCAVQRCGHLGPIHP